MSAKAMGLPARGYVWCGQLSQQPLPRILKSPHTAALPHRVEQRCALDTRVFGLVSRSRLSES